MRHRPTPSPRRSLPALGCACACGLLVAAAPALAAASSAAPAAARDGPFHPAERTAGAPGARAIILGAPLPVRQASFFYGAIEVPPLDTARPLPLGVLTVRLFTWHARTLSSRRIGGVQQRFNGLYHEWVGLEVRAGVLRRIELSARAGLSGWDEKLDIFSLFDRQGAPIVREEDPVILGKEASRRHENVTRVTLGAKALVLTRAEAGLDLALALSVKLPFGRARDLTNAGTTDLNATVLASLALGPVRVHANLGGGFPLGAQTLFTRDASVELDPFLHGGLALTARLWEDGAAVLQVQGNTSAFSEVDLLDGSPLTIFGGVRAFLGDVFLEGGLGTGLLPRSSYDWGLFVSVGLVL